MKRVTSLALIFGIALAVSACESTEGRMEQTGESPQADANSMSASEITDYVADKTAYGTIENGSEFAIYYDPSGEVRGKSSGSWGTSSDTGTWKVTADDMLCLKFKKWRNGANRCWQLYDEGGTITWVGRVGPANTGPDDDTWKQGNVENL